MASRKKRFDWKIFLLLPVPLLWGWLQSDGYLQTLEHLLLDMRFRARGNIEAPVKVFYVDLDTRGIQRIGERPWNRARFAEAAQLVLEEGKAKSVGFDFVFSDFGHSDLVNKEEANKGNFAFARVARKHPELVLAAQYTGGEASTQQGTREFPLIRRGIASRDKVDVPELPQYPMVNPAWSATIGLIDIDYDYAADQVPRWAPLFAESAMTDFWHLAVQLSCIELGVPPGSVRRNGDFLDIVTAEGQVLRHIPLTAQQLLEINWFSMWDNQSYNPRSSMADVLIAGEMLKSDKESEREEAAEYFKRFAGATVLVGPVDPLLQDLAPTPFDGDPVPKVGSHGNLIKTIISERYLHRPEEWVFWTSLFMLTAVVTALTTEPTVRSFRRSAPDTKLVPVLTDTELAALLKALQRQAFPRPPGRGVDPGAVRRAASARRGGGRQGQCWQQARAVSPERLIDLPTAPAGDPTAGRLRPQVRLPAGAGVHQLPRRRRPAARPGADEAAPSAGCAGHTRRPRGTPSAPTRPRRRSPGTGPQVPRLRLRIDRTAGVPGWPSDRCGGRRPRARPSRRAGRLPRAGHRRPRRLRCGHGLWASAPQGSTGWWWGRRRHADRCPRPGSGHRPGAADR